ncbi:MAG: carboxypeptidase regulatory-like domain-containing protein [Planctomycetes bacterium]|nr:carboxypeptidase regulatory-like domain-containing protein [Planctomycetota bacterium]
MPALAPTPSGARIGGRTVDELLVPVGGARVSQYGEDAARATPAASDGSFELGVQPDRQNMCALLIEAEGFATRFLEVTLQEHEAKTVGDVVLQPGGSLRGRVFGPDGAPFAGASVSVTQPDLWDSLENARIHGPRGSELLSALSQADGRFEIHGVGVGPMRAWAGAEGMRYAVSPPVEVRARQTTDEVELQLEAIHADDRIRGIVLSPEGEPVPGARLGSMERSGGGMTTHSFAADAEGRFELVAKAGRVYDLRASDPTERWSAIQVRSVQPGTHDLELRFEEARWIEVSVSAQEGELGELVVHAESPDDGWIASAKETARLDGRVHARLLLPTEQFLVQVDARGFRLGEQGPFTPESAPTSLDFELVPEPGVRGRVVAGGEPVAGARVALHRASPRSRIEDQGYLTLADPRAEDRTSTDADGRFTLKLREPDTYVVRAEAPGYAASDTGALELALESGRSGLELALGRGGNLEGRVRVAPGHEPSGVIVSLNRGDAFPRTLRSDSEGRFSFEGLTPGPWQLARGRMEFNPQGGGTAYSGADEPIVLPFNCTIVEGETTYQDLDLSDYEPCVLSGVLRVNGAPAPDWSVAGWPGGAHSMVGELPSSATAADGTFALTIEDGRPVAALLLAASRERRRGQHRRPDRGPPRSERVARGLPDGPPGGALHVAAGGRGARPALQQRQRRGALLQALRPAGRGRELRPALRAGRQGLDSAPRSQRRREALDDVDRDRSARAARARARRAVGARATAATAGSAPGTWRSTPSRSRRSPRPARRSRRRSRGPSV